LSRDCASLATLYRYAFAVAAGNAAAVRNRAAYASAPHVAVDTPLAGIGTVLAAVGHSSVMSRNAHISDRDDRAGTQARGLKASRGTGYDDDTNAVSTSAAAGAVADSVAAATFGVAAAKAGRTTSALTSALLLLLSASPG